MFTTLKTKLRGKEPVAGVGTTKLTFEADYQDGRNQEWATATPVLNIMFTVKDEIADRFEPGTAYTFAVSESDD